MHDILYMRVYDYLDFVAPVNNVKDSGGGGERGEQDTYLNGLLMLVSSNNHDNRWGHHTRQCVDLRLSHFIIVVAE